MKKVSKLSIPNIITSTRIVGSVFLLLTNPMSWSFFILYTLCGISDAIDGWIARATKSESEFGAKLDSIADLLFYSVLAIQIFPFLLRVLPRVLWYVAISVILVRLVIYIFVAIKYRRFASIHTYLNKTTGFIIFMLPYFILYAATVPVCCVLAVVSGIAAIEELLIHVCSKSYQSNTKSLLQLLIRRL